MRFELRLTVDGPGKIPVVGAVLNGDDTAGGYLTRTRVALADIHNVLYYLFVGGRNGGTHPVSGVNIRTEVIGIAVFAVLRLSGDGLPHIPRFARTVFNTGQVGRMGLIAVAGGVCAATVGDKHKIVLNQVDSLLLAVLDINDLLGNLFAALGFDDNIPYIHTVLERRAIQDI